ncbi:MAG: ABC transporter permease [Eubacterium sp.]|nr:ABC transporter permease [Eubacterium sp.]
METYKDLGTKYLKTNRKRSFITVLGCFIVAAGLFMFLNSMVCWIEKCRIDARADGDWEILVLTDDKNIIEEVANEDFVQSAFLGKEYANQTEDDDGDVYANALHINVKQKLLINHYSKYIHRSYGVEVETNSLLAWTYFQDDEGVGYIMLLAGLLISFVLAIIGVGVLRNNISISAMERVKDYGNLRCIGATKKQIRAIVYRESFALESLGMAAGILAGFLLSIPICLNEKRQYPVGFHILPVIFLAIAFYGDMYFAVGDGLKKVLAVSPAEAVRGTYRVKNKKIRRRRSGIWGALFGVEGDYAYKNIKRNNGRFLKTIGAMAFGMIIVVVVGGEMEVFYDFYKQLNDQYGYYQQYIICNTSTSVLSYEEQRTDLYSPKALKKIGEAKGIDSPKYMYQSTLYAAEDQFILNNLTEEYHTNTFEGELYGMSELDASVKEEEKTKREEYRDKGQGLVDYESREEVDEVKNGRKNPNNDEFCTIIDSEIDIYGYDTEDYERYKDNLIDGTTELSENGVLLINQADITPLDSFDSNTIFEDMKPFTFSDFKVGDEITVVDPTELYNLVQEERKIAKAFDDEMHAKAEQWSKDHKDEKDEDGDQITNPYEEYTDVENTKKKQAWIINSAREKLVEEGKVKTYVIEGIVRDDPNWMSTEPTIVVPLDKFYEMTGKTESDYNGMKFHVSNIFSRDLQKDAFMNTINEKQSYWYEGIEDNGPTYNSETSTFLEGVLLLISGLKAIIGISFGFVVLIIISLLNTMNVTISGLQTRRSEFAQLRAMGMTKKSLLKAVVLEGGIVWIIATILGIIIGIAIQYALYISVVKLIINTPMRVFWIGIVITAILSFVVLCGSNYIFFKQMKLNVAEELTRSGE